MTTQQVTVTDVDMKFGSMVWFMIKWAIASIPAMFILGMGALLLSGFGVVVLGALGVAAAGAGHR